jgi:hypothetical protein
MSVIGLRPAVGLAVAGAIAVAGCGGSSKSSSSGSGAGTSTSATPQAAPAGSAGSAGGKASVSTGPVHGVLRAPNHAPKIDKPWIFTVRVTDAAGHPLDGTLDVEFLFKGQVVGRDTPPTHTLKNGHWREKLKFPAPAVGQPLIFRVVAHTSRGTLVLDWPVTAVA